MALVQSEPARLTRAYRSGVLTCALVSCPRASFAILSEEIILLLLGPAWIGVAAPLRILAWGMLFRASYKMSDTIARATGAVWARAWRQAILRRRRARLSIVGQAWGLGGVAFGVLAALGLNFLMMASLSLRLTGMRWSDFAWTHVPGIVLAILVGAASALAAAGLRADGAGPFLTVALTTGLAAVSGALAVWSRPAFFLGPDAERLLRAVSNVLGRNSCGERANEGRRAVAGRRLGGRFQDGSASPSWSGCSRGSGRPGSPIATGRATSISSPRSRA